MGDIKNVKVTYHTLMQRMWKKRKEEETEEAPFFLIEQVFNYISKLSKKAKFHDLKNNKFCYLETIDKKEVNNTFLFTGLLKSARNEFRPDLINKRTGIERKNPKEITEGDIEKTHFLVKIDHELKEVYLFLECNFYGVNINSFIDYFTRFTKGYCKKNDLKKNFTLFSLEIPNNNFLSQLEILSRTSLAEVFFNKQLLGSKALNFSDRIISLKQDLILTARSTIKESITEVAVDFYNKLQQKDSPISRIRIRGIDPNKNEVILDTSFMCKKDLIKVDLNPETGEVNSAQLYLGLKNIANAF